MSKLSQAITYFQQTNADRRYESVIHTNARVGIGHVDGHLCTKDWLCLQSDFAQAKDAVSVNLDIDAIKQACAVEQLSTITLHSQAQHITEFLLRPDFGRALAPASVAELMQCHQTHKDVLIIISGGLSPYAVNQQIPEFLPAFMEYLRASQMTLAPVIINPRGRVALGDDVNEYLRAKITVMLIGERPGLGVSNSMGIYFTYHARKGCTDDRRNCISNVHQNGLSPAHAASKLHYMITKSMQKQLSGVALKDDQMQHLTHL